jgi:hypothetical protein
MCAFQQFISERDFRCQEFEMLHRMTTLLSAVVVASLAAFVQNAVFPTAARADNCITRPTGNPGAGRHWYFQINRVTHQKCWMPGGKKIPAAETAAVRNVATPGGFDPASIDAMAESAAADACGAAPKGRGARGGRWHYRIDEATGRPCRWRSARAQLRKPHVAEARRPADDLPRPAPATRLAAFQRAFDARAEFLDRFNLADRRIEPVSLPVAVTAEATDVSFASRWSRLLDPAPAVDRRPGPPAPSQLDMPVAALFDDVTPSTRGGERLFTAERSLYVTLLVFLASLAGALVVFGLIGVVVLYVRARYARSALRDRPNSPEQAPPNHAASAGPDGSEQ